MLWAFFVQILFLELLIQRLRLKAYNEMKISPIDFTIFGQIWKYFLKRMILLCDDAKL